MTDEGATVPHLPAPPLGRRTEPLGEADPRRLGRLELLCRLPGSGVESRVYVAWDDQSAEPVVVKVLLAADRTARERFAREVANARRVSSPHVARILDSGEDSGLPYLVQELAPGQPLDELLEQLPDRRLDVENAQRLALGLLEALRATHAAGVLHRDVKPSNVVVGPRGQRLVDFGISHYLSDATLTMSGTAVGTRRFMSPEQLDGMALTSAADLFAWGITVALASAGHHPFDPEGSLDEHRYAQAVRHGRPDLRGVPGALRPAVAQALRPRPEDRGTIDSLVRLLDRTDVVRTATAVIPLDEPAALDRLSLRGVRRAGEPYLDELRLRVADTSAGFLALCAAALVLAFLTSALLAPLLAGL